MREHEYHWHRIDCDPCGNPRYVIHWLALGFPSYEEALAVAKEVGGRKYHNKRFGGGIAFQSYCLEETEAEIKKAVANWRKPTTKQNERNTDGRL